MTQFYAVVVITMVEYAWSHEYHLPICDVCAHPWPSEMVSIYNTHGLLYNMYGVQYVKTINVSECVYRVLKKKSAIFIISYNIMYNVLIKRDSAWFHPRRVDMMAQMRFSVHIQNSSNRFSINGNKNKFRIVLESLVYIIIISTI